MMQRVVHLPTGAQPGWESQEMRSGGGGLRSVSESLVVLQSLRQSRSKWTTSMLPKFSTKARGSKATEIIPPPHNIKAHGKYDLHIGPHVFSNTAIYEVHYLPERDPSEAHSTQGPPASPPTQSSQSQTSPPFINMTPFTYVTPELSARVIAEAQTNPTLANLLNAVVNRTATDDQIKTLGLLVQSLRDVDLPPGDSAPAPIASTSTMAPPATIRAGSPKPFDLVLEFHERPTDRFILPRGNVVCERVGVTEGAWSRSSDVIITTSFSAVRSPNTPPPPTDGQPLETVVSEVVKFRLTRVPQHLWDLLLAWAGGPSKIDENRAKLAEIAKNAPPRSYLPHRLPEGELLSEIQSAVAPPYTTKSIKPTAADSTRAKRKAVSRRATIASESPSSPPQKTPTVKRRQSLKAKASIQPPPPIACRACGQTDVPLMMGGRYCRTCIDAGKAIADIPHHPSSKTNSTAPTQPPSAVFPPLPSQTTPAAAAAAVPNQRTQPDPQVPQMGLPATFTLPPKPYPNPISPGS